MESKRKSFALGRAPIARGTRRALRREVQVTNSYFSQIETWLIPETVIPDALAEMAIDGSDGNEGIVLFLGRDRGCTAEVTHLVKLRGPGLEKHPLQIKIDAALLNEVTDVAIEN